MANLAQEAVYSQYYNSVVQLAQKTDGNGRIGVSRPELIHALGISRTIADGLIARCKLRRSRVEGKTEFFSLSRGSKNVVSQGSDTKETTTMTDAGSAPAASDPKGLVGAIVGDDQPAPTAQKGGKKGKNRLPPEEPTGTPPAAPENAAPVPPVPAPSVEPGKKSLAQIDEEIKAIQVAMKTAGSKSEAAYQTYLAQKAHQEALGVKLQAALTARLTNAG